MISLDTHVIVRLLVRDDLEQQAQVLSRLQSIRDHGDQALITTVVLAEVGWVLASGYGYSRTQIGAAISAMLMAEPFHFQDRSVIEAALQDYEQGPADLSDYLVLNQAHVAEALPLLTFDKKLLRHGSAERP